MNKTIVGLLAAIVVLAVFVIMRVAIATPDPAQKIKQLPANEYDPAVWGKYYPLEYKSFQKNLEMSASPTGFGGSINVQKSLKEPEILMNFKGMAFSEDYSEDRGHPYALEDLLKSKRVTPKTPGACMTCKTANLKDLWQETGWNYAKAPLTEITPRLKHSITCANCHDPQTMKLRVINPAFVEAMKKRDIDVNQASREQMRTYVCAQCHVEYYFEPGTTKVVFPWEKGLEPEKIYEYYAARPSGFGEDWVHPDSQVKLLKAQHPEFETWSGGVHGRADVACADCHMPYMRKDGRKYSSHRVTSPMRHVEASCGPCHDQGNKWLVASVKSTQDKVWQLQRTAGQTVAHAHEALAAAKASPAQMEEARELLRRAQWYWDFVAAENGMGFHNPTQALNTLALSIDSANQAILAVKTGK
ncbi:MAG: Cytochrome c-552 precursor [Syntrophorhabdaceae bacterium PtaU1.Bin034]|nr:MAG: Cytochrome c-552 precursor [Syntrophorhabdaceae bacterium PtaU1.Bin034]